MSKRLTALLLALAMLCAAASALAENPEYTTTQDFLASLERVEVPYEYLGKNDSEHEVVTVTNTDSEYGVKVFTFFFARNLEEVYIRVWNAIDFDPADRAEVLDICNRLNSSFHYATFYVDDSDNSVTLASDAMLANEAGGDITLNILLRLHTVLSGIYSELAPYAK